MRRKELLGKVVPQWPWLLQMSKAKATWLLAGHGKTEEW